MKKLHFHWIAYYKDGKTLKQFNDEGQENLFTEVDKFPEKFEKFELVNILDDSITHSVNLINGDLKFNGVLIKNNIDLSEADKIKCIYFRRCQRMMNNAGETESVKIACYLLGWQTNIKGANIKKEYIIFPDNSIQEVMQKYKRQIKSVGNIKK